MRRLGVVALLLVCLGCSRTRVPAPEVRPSGTAGQTATAALPDATEPVDPWYAPREPRQPAEFPTVVPHASDAPLVSWPLAASMTLEGTIWWSDWYDEGVLTDDLVLYTVIQRVPPGPPQFLIAADLEAEEILWETALPEDQYLSQPVAADSSPIILYRPGIVVAGFDRRTGEMVWEREAPEPFDRDFWGGAIASAADGILFLRPQAISMMDPAGWAERWSVPLDAPGRLVHYDPPTMRGDRAYFIVDNEGGAVRIATCVDASSRRVLWQQRVGPEIWVMGPRRQGGCAAGPDGVFCLADLVGLDNVGMEETQLSHRAVLVCLDHEDGHRRWETVLPAYPRWDYDGYVSPVTCGEYVVVPVEGHRLPDQKARWLIVRGSDGEPVASLEGVVPMERPLALGDRLLALAEEEDELWLIDLPACTVTARVKLPVGCDGPYMVIHATKRHVWWVESQWTEDRLSVESEHVYVLKRPGA